jgi:hypothetical protein
VKKRRNVFMFMTRLGRICIATDGPVSTYAGPVETLFAHVRKTYTNIYTTGLLCNAAFAAETYTACADKTQMFMLGPRYCGRAACGDSPQRILHAMRKCCLPGSQGGWIQVDKNVVPALHCRYGRVKPEGVWQNLPFWRDVAFVDSLNTDATVSLVGHIGDPRWFLTCEDTTQYAALFSYLGLTPEVMRMVMAGEVSGVRSKRCYDALRAWNAADVAPAGPLFPGQFLWETWRKHADPVVANLRTTQRFVQYVVRVWHKRLFPDKHPHAELLFVPDRYFSAQVAAAYEKHLLLVR